jgi:hypothetical protein
MTVRRQDLARFETGLGANCQTSDDALPWVDLTMPNPAHPLFDERYCLAEAGLAFVGRYEGIAGEEPTLFAAHGGRMLEVGCVGNRPAVVVDTAGNIRDNQLKHVREFLALRKHAVCQIGCPR